MIYILLLGTHLLTLLRFTSSPYHGHSGFRHVHLRTKADRPIPSAAIFIYVSKSRAGFWPCFLNIYCLYIFMCVCVFVCMNVFMYAFMYMHNVMNMYVYVYIYIYIYWQYMSMSK